MSSRPAPTDPRLAQVAAALQRRDAATATAIVKSWPDASPFLVAQVAQAAGDTTAEEAALHKALAQNPRHVGALLAMGDLKQRIGDDRAATSFFRTALAQAAVTPQPREVAPFLQRAQLALEITDGVAWDIRPSVREINAVSSGGSVFVTSVLEPELAPVAGRVPS